jgi:phytanoyl-CoA hydroxylase
MRAGVEAAVGRAADLADRATTTINVRGHRIQTVPGDPPTSLHWEPEADPPVVRNLRPVAHLDPRLAARWHDPRLTGPAAGLLGVPEVAPLTSKSSLKRAHVGSEYTWHTDHSFLAGFLGPDAAGEVVTAMILLDAADAGNGALTLVPGSHRDGPRPDDEPPRPGDGEPVLVEARAGSVVFFPSTMVHRSDANRSARDRRALLYLFQPAGRPYLDETRRV